MAIVLAFAPTTIPDAARAQARDVGSQRTPREHRTALVIGNATYAESPLNNPANDARGIAQVLRAQGFEVIELVNADLRGMRRGVVQFGERLHEGGVGLFYYSGHGTQVNGRNYLIPIGAQIPSEGYVSAEALDVDSVLGQMDAARSLVNIVILDACRNNPFARRFRSPQRGLAFMQAPLGTFIAYATSPGDVADDGPPGGYGVFTGELLKAIREQVKIEDVFKRVGRSVQERTQRRQTPWTASNLTGDFSFVPPTVATVTPAPPPRLEIKEEARPKVGSLALSTKLDGVEVWVDDQRIGETRGNRTFAVSDVSEGTHRLRARKPGHEDWERDVKVAANQRVDVSLDLRPIQQPSKRSEADEGRKVALVPPRTGFADVPMPERVEVTPPDALLPSDVAAWVGLWKGFWHNGAAHVLVVLRIGAVQTDGTYPVRVLYGYGRTSGGKVTPFAVEADATLKGSVLSIVLSAPTGSVMRPEYRLRKDGAAIEGYYRSSTGLAMQGVFTKQP